jgi:hypothetical protein
VIGDGKSLLSTRHVERDLHQALVGAIVTGCSVVGECVGCRTWRAPLVELVSIQDVQPLRSAGTGRR